MPQIGQEMAIDLQVVTDSPDSVTDTMFVRAIVVVEL